MKLVIKNQQGNDQGELEVSFPVIENGKGTQAVHDVVVAHNAARRSGTACTKTMGEVAGSGKKPWRQKGTGRARAGSFRSPLWSGGGTTFGPKPRDYRKKVTQKTKRTALRKALSERLKDGDVVVIDDLNFGAPKTKELLRVLAALDLNGTVTVVAPEVNRNLLLSARNLKYVNVATSDSLNTYQVLEPDHLLFVRSAFEKVEQRIKPE